MAKPLKISSAVSYGEKPDTSQRYFQARIQQNSKSLVAKTFSIGRVRTEQEAYDEAIKALRDLEKEYKVAALKVPPMKELIESYRNRSVKQPAPKVATKENPLVEKFGHAGQFRAMIIHAMKAHGVEKVRDLLNDGLRVVKEAEAEFVREAAVKLEANKKIAYAIMEARLSGIDMPAPSKEIEALIDKLTLEAATSKSTKKKPVEQMYELDGERWNGVGHPPAAFIKYGQKHDGDYSGLLVR